MFDTQFTVLFLTLAVLQFHHVLSDIIKNEYSNDTFGTNATATNTSDSPFSKSEELRNTSLSNATDIIVKMMSQKCSKVYSLTCFKLDMIRLVDRLGHLPSYQILPGVSFVHLSSDTGVRELPIPLVNALAQGNISNELDEFLATRINTYLNSFTLSVKLLDQNTVAKAKQLGADILEGFSKNAQTGRKKGYGGAVWAAGTIATLGMAGLAAMAGKAMMTSMLALMLAAAGAMRGGGGAGGGGEKCAHHYITAHGRNMDMQELMQKPIDVSSAVYKTVFEREP